MAIRILMLILSLTIAANLIILLVSFICGENLYQKHGKIIRNCHLGFVLLIIII